jgi:hypothetical protein
MSILLKHQAAKNGYGVILSRNAIKNGVTCWRGVIVDITQQKILKSFARQ